MQASCNELTLAPHNGPWLHETGILSLSPLPRDVQTFLQHVLQQEHRPTRPSQTMPCCQGTERTSRQCSTRWRTTTGIGRPGILIPLFPHGMARKGYRAIHGPTQTDHRQPPPGIPRRRRQGGIPPRTNPPTHSEDTEATLHATGLLDPTSTTSTTGTHNPDPTSTSSNFYHNNGTAAWAKRPTTTITSHTNATRQQRSYHQQTSQTSWP